jgi:hypothetical protein
MIPTMDSFTSLRPEYSRVERYLDLAQLYQNLSQPQRALDTLGKYLAWYPADEQALATKQELLRQLPSQH